MLPRNLVSSVMKIVVRRTEDTSSPTVTYFLDVDSATSVATLKSLVQQCSGIAPAQQRLTVVMFGCKVLLSEAWTCGFYNVQEGSRVHLEVLSSGGQRLPQSCQRYYKRLGVTSSPQSRLAQAAILVSPRQSCERGDVESLLRLIASSENPQEMLSQPSARGWTCLHLTAHRGFCELTRLLLAHKVAANVESMDEWTPLMLACYRGNSECIEILLADSSVDVNARTNRGTALHIAALKGRPQVCKRLLESGALPTLTDGKGQIPLEVTSCQEIAELIPRFFGERLMEELGAGAGTELPFCGELDVLTDQSKLPAKGYFVLDYQAQTFSQYASRDAFYSGSPAHLSLPFHNLLNLTTSEFCLGDQLYHQMSLFWEQGSLRCASLYPEIIAEWKSRLVVNMQHFQGPERTLSVYTEPETPALESSVTERSEENPYLSPFYGISKEITSEIAGYGFTLVEEIGQGSFGKVFKVLSKDGTYAFAVKCLNKATLQKQGQLEYAVQENKVMKQLDHPFIVKLYYSFQSPKSLYFLMEYCPNGDLGTHINEKEKLSEAEVRFYAAETLLALEYLHKKNIVYRDMKPDNVLLDSQGHVRLADFGLAKNVKSARAVTSTFCGSPAYLAPEMLSHSGVGRSADIYSLGVLMFEMATGQPPFFSYNIEEMYRNISSQEAPMPDSMSSELAALLRKMLSRNPAARPTIADLKKDAFFQELKWKHVASKRIAPPKLSSFWHQTDTLEVSLPPPKSLWANARGYARTLSMEECVPDFD